MEPFGVAERHSHMIDIGTHVAMKGPDRRSRELRAIRAATVAAADDGFLALYDRSFDRLVQLAYLTTGSSAAAEDVVQDVFIDVMRRWEAIENPDAYVRRAVVNACTSWLRRVMLERRHASAADLREAVWHDRDALELTDALRSLSARQRAAVVLRYVVGCSEREIAEALDCRTGTVKSLLARARAVLKEVLNDVN